MDALRADCDCGNISGMGGASLQSTMGCSTSTNLVVASSGLPTHKTILYVHFNTYGRSLDRDEDAFEQDEGVMVKGNMDASRSNLSVSFQHSPGAIVSWRRAVSHVLVLVTIPKT